MAAASLHRLGCEALRLAGGTLCENLLPDEDHKELSDAVFKADRVIWEVKTLTEDRSLSVGFQKKMRGIIGEYLPGGLGAFDPSDIFKGLPAQQVDWLLLELAKPVLKKIEKAHGQIAQTAERLAWSDAMGALMLLVPASFAAQPDVMAATAWRALQQGKYPLLRYLLFINTPSERDRRPLAVIGSPRGDTSELPPGLTQRIGRAWIQIASREAAVSFCAVPMAEADLDTHFPRAADTATTS